MSWDSFLLKRRHKEPEAKPEPQAPQVITLRQSDTLERRARIIVDMMGFRGAIDGFVLNVMEALEAYQRLDREAWEAGTGYPLRATGRQAVEEQVDETEPPATANG